MIIKKHKKRNKQEIEKFLAAKDTSENYLEWCKWAGWMDTDGTIKKQIKNNRSDQNTILLRLKDRQPVELFGDFFESNLLYLEYKTTTPEPYKKEYLAKIFYSALNGSKTFFLLKKIYPYLLNERKKQEAVKILGYTPKSKPLDDWTKDEVISYLATVIEGDGTIKLAGNINKTMTISIKSSTLQYLSDIKYLVDKNFNTCLSLIEACTYQTKKGIRTKYDLFFNKSHMEIFKLLVKDNIMTLDRKKNKILEYLNQTRFHNRLN